MGGACSAYGGEGGVYRVLVRKPNGKKPLGRPRRGWQDDYWMNIQDVEFEDMDIIQLAQDSDRLRALVNEVMNIMVP
jgi:hypothetical protein